VLSKAVVRQPLHELIQVAEAVAVEKNLDVEDVFSAMESAVKKIAETKYGAEHDIRASINRESGEISVYKVLTVVETVENELTEISLEKAKEIQPDAELGSEIFETLPPVDFGRTAACEAREIIMYKIKRIEREHQYAEFIGRKGEIVSGIVKQVDQNHTIIDIGRTEGILRKENSIPRQILRVGDRVKALLLDIRPDADGPMLILSRTNSRFITKLFEQEMTEVYDGIIKVVAVARDPGSRAKVAVYAPDQRVDAVGACVGVRGSRVQAVSSELCGEKIDVVLWSQDPATYVINAFAIQEIKRVVIDEEAGRINVVVDDNFLSQAIGRRGQNVRLVSMLTKWRISVLSEAADSEKRLAENSSYANTLMKTLEIDEMMAQLLIAEGFFTIDDVAQAELEDFVSIGGLDDKTALELKQKAERIVTEQEEYFFKMCKELGVNEDILTLDGLDITMLTKLIESGVRTLCDIADLSDDEMVEIVGEELLSKVDAGSIVMESRKSWFVADNANHS
jgi:N utilization substance protein A